MEVIKQQPKAGSEAHLDSWQLRLEAGSRQALGVSPFHSTAAPLSSHRPTSSSSFQFPHSLTCFTTPAHPLAASSFMFLLLVALVFRFSNRAFLREDRRGSSSLVIRVINCFQAAIGPTEGRTQLGAKHLQPGGAGIPFKQIPSGIVWRIS